MIRLVKCFLMLYRFTNIFRATTTNLKVSNITKRMSTNANEIPSGFVEIVEGSARMLYDEKEAVFYNKVQVLNRDLSIQVIRLYAETLQKERQAKYEVKMEKYRAGKSSLTDREPYPPVQGISVLDALAATGLRSIRYLKEIPGVREMVINDLLKEATDAAMVNCRSNGVDESKIKIHNRDAVMLMYENREPTQQFDVIDLDPYGSVCPFLDGAVQAVADGGLLCVTCTDAAVLSGNYPEVCYSKYGSMPLRTNFFAEMQLRVLLNAIEASATKYKRYIVPWISLSVDFYVRVFVRVYESAAEAKKSCLRKCMVLQSQTQSFYVQPVAHLKGATTYNPHTQIVPAVCEEIGKPLRIGGPFWSGPIHNQEIVDTLFERVASGIDYKGPTELLPFPVSTAPRLAGMLSTITEELKDVLFYYVLPQLAGVIQTKTPTHLEFKSALLNGGYRVSAFHHEANAIKTDAPSSVVWDIMRCFAKINPPLGNKKKTPNPVGIAILSKEPVFQADFTPHESLVGGGGKRKLARFHENPEAHWGPKRRAGNSVDAVADAEKKQAAKEALMKEKHERRVAFRQNNPHLNFKKPLRPPADSVPMETEEVNNDTKA